LEATQLLSSLTNNAVTLLILKHTPLFGRIMSEIITSHYHLLHHYFQLLQFIQLFSDITGTSIAAKTIVHEQN
jgi:hypothetical protein